MRERRRAHGYGGYCLPVSGVTVSHGLGDFAIMRHGVLSLFAIALSACAVVGSDSDSEVRAQWLRIIAERFPDAKEHQEIARLEAGSRQKPVNCHGAEHGRSVLQRLVSADSPKQDDVLRSLDINRHAVPEKTWLPIMHLVWMEQLTLLGGATRQLAVFGPSPRLAHWSHATLIMTDENYRVLDWRQVTKGWNLNHAQLRTDAGQVVWSLNFNADGSLGSWTVVYRLSEDRFSQTCEQYQRDEASIKRLEESIELISQPVTSKRENSERCGP